MLRKVSYWYNPTREKAYYLLTDYVSRYPHKVGLKPEVLFVEIFGKWDMYIKRHQQGLMAELLAGQNIQHIISHVAGSVCTEAMLNGAPVPRKFEGCYGNTRNQYREDFLLEIDRNWLMLTAM